MKQDPLAGGIVIAGFLLMVGSRPFIFDSVALLIIGGIVAAAGFGLGKAREGSRGQ